MEFHWDMPELARPMEALAGKARTIIETVHRADKRASLLPYHQGTTRLTDPAMVQTGGSNFWKYFDQATPKREGGMVWIPTKIEHAVR